MNDPVIAEFRANRGVLRRRRWPVLLLTTTGARTGMTRVTPLNFTIDGERIVVIASKAGAPTNPAWFRNLVAHPEVTIELGPERFRARARVAEEPERTHLYDQQAKVMTFFDGYRKRVKAREIPVVVFERLEVSR
jgi:deazaflavin-dependent oxidoreductase (nitroreductase family)